MHSGSPSRDSRTTAAPADTFGRRLPSWIPLAVIAVGVVVRLVAVAEPTAVYSPAPWREADYLQIARNFLREGVNPFLPHVDWRGATSGAAEMELPVLPWIASLLFRVTGVYAVVLRLLAAACSIGSLFVFRRLADRLLAPSAAAAGLLLFALSPFAVTLGAAMQPEPLLLLTLLLAGLAIVRWTTDDTSRALFAAAAWTAVAILVKASAAHLGLVLALFVVRRHGVFGWLRRRDVVVAALIALVPPLAWYGWAHSLYLDTGLSLGLSNETHGLSRELLAAPGAALAGNAVVELWSVFTPAGVVLALVGLARARGPVLVATVWYGAVLVFYALSLDTSGDAWAAYYHVLSVPAAVLLMGAGVQQMLRRGRVVAVLGVLLLAVTAAGSALQSWRMYGNRHNQPALVAFHDACVSLSAALPRNARVAVRGGERLDAHGHPVAFNASMAFAWLDRMGDNYAVEDATPAAVDALAREGCTHWLVLPADAADPDLSAPAGRLPVVARSGDYAVVLLEARR